MKRKTAARSCAPSSGAPASAPRIITGTEEARLIHLAAVYGVDTPKPAVVIDIGGGSVEITLGGKTDVEFARSFKIGVIRLSERFVDSDPISSRDERKMTKFIREQVDRYIEHIVEQGYDRVIGTSGTILSLGTVATAVDRGSVPQEVRNLRVPAKSIRRLRRTVVESDLEERMHLPGLDPRRADLMVAGAVLLDTLLKELDAEEITLCDLALREGVLLDYIHRHRKDITRVDRYPDVRRRSVVELAERCAWEAEHSRQVAALALTLFDYTKRIHNLGDREREWLEYAGFLHDIGNHISYEKHHRHSYYLIKHGDLRGFEPEEIDVIALLTRYHRRATPKRGHIGFDDLNHDLRRAVKSLRPSCGSPRRSIAAGTASFAASKCVSGWASSTSRSRQSVMPSWRCGPRTNRPPRSKKRWAARCASRRCPTGKRPPRLWRWRMPRPPLTRNQRAPSLSLE